MKIEGIETKTIFLVTPRGQVVGATDARGYTAVERILSPENFASTIYTKLGIDPARNRARPGRLQTRECLSRPVTPAIEAILAPVVIRL
jgi:hypothetical protein